MVEDIYRDDLAMACPQELISKLLSPEACEALGYSDLGNKNYKELLEIGMEIQAKLRYMWADAMIKVGAERS